MVLSKAQLTKIIRQKIRTAGFHLAGIAQAKGLDRADFLAGWLQAGKHGTMRWMENYLDKRLNIFEYFPETKSVVMAAHNYYTDYPHPASQAKGKISRYAWGRDYHRIIKKKLKKVLMEIKALHPDIQGQLFVDTAPVQEKLWAQRAGIGWQGKHTNIISREYGSWIFMGGMVLNVDLDYDQPALDYCGSCTACIDACPTNALKPYELDARRCISYLTIENKEDRIKPEFQGKLDNWIFGCDICQDVCPWNQRAKLTDEPQYHPQEENIAPDLEELSQISENEFRQRFGKSPVLRARRQHFIRNVKTVIKSNG